MLFFIFEKYCLVLKVFWDIVSVIMKIRGVVVNLFLFDNFVPIKFSKQLVYYNIGNVLQNVTY